MVSREPLRATDPRAISSYRLVARLGQGGMGVVYLGEAPDGRPVAIKVIRSHLAMHEDFRARFRAEVATASRVARFCTAPILDADTAADPPYIVSEYIDGPTLGEVVKEHGALPGARLHALGVGVANALGAIHRAGIMHRDLKPSNVILSQFGPQVIDFGIARAVDAVTSITQPGRMMGSPSYMAPEQLRGDTLTRKVDVFAWGAVMTFAGTGHQPFSGSTDAVFYQVLYGEPDLRGLDPLIADLVVWAVRKEPDERPTAEQLLDALVGGGQPPAAAGLSAPAGAGEPGAGEPGAGEPSTGERRSGEPVRVGALAAAWQGTRVGAQAGELGLPSAADVLLARAPSTVGPAPPRAPAPPVDFPGRDAGPSHRRGRRPSRHSGTRARRHPPGRRTSTRLRLIVVGVMGAVLGASGSFATVGYLDFRDARKEALDSLGTYLSAIHEENYGAAYNRLCTDITDKDTSAHFEQVLKSRPGIESFALDRSVPFRLSDPYAVTADITEKNGNSHTSVFEVRKEVVGGRHRYVVCHILH